MLVVAGSLLLSYRSVNLQITEYGVSLSYMNESKFQSDMTSLFGPVDDEWQSTTRSIRINGKVTSVRLENFHWRIILEIAEKERLQLSQLMTMIARLADSSDGDHSNFTSFVRVCCVRYLQARMNEALNQNSVIAAEPTVSAQRLHAISQSR